LENLFCFLISTIIVFSNMIYLIYFLNCIQYRDFKKVFKINLIFKNITKINQRIVFCVTILIKKLVLKLIFLKYSSNF
jgi:hypothetical protein